MFYVRAQFIEPVLTPHLNPLPSGERVGVRGNPLLFGERVGVREN
jgi:hypothetical protein